MNLFEGGAVVGVGDKSTANLSSCSWCFLYARPLWLLTTKDTKESAMDTKVFEFNT